MISYLSNQAVPAVLFYIPLLAVIFCYVTYHLIYSKRISRWKKSNIPFLKPSFLIGHKYFLNLAKNSYLVSLDRIYKENQDKDAVGFFLGTIPLILLRNPRLIQQVFVKNSDKTFETGWANGSKDDLISKNMIHISSDKNIWKNNRKTMMPLFSTFFISGEQFDKIGEQLDKMHDHIRDVNLNGRPVNVKETIQNFTRDTAALLYFGQDVNSHKENGVLYRLMDSFSKPSLVRMISVYAQIQFPGARWIPDCLKFVNSAQIDEMEKLLSDQLERRKGQITNGGDFLDLMTALGKGGKAEDGESNSGMNIRQMAGLAFSVSLFGKGVCLCNSISVSIYMLSHHPEYQDRIREEVLESMRKHGTSNLSFDVVNDLPFTHQYLLETARLYPISSSLVRTVAEDFQIAGSDYTFRKGDKLVIAPYSMQRDPKNFENPDAFDPERFSPENSRSLPHENFLSFGIGQRKCPGYNIGLQLEKGVIASLLLKYRINPRSHLKQLDTTDFHPRAFFNSLRDDLLVDLVPLDTKDRNSRQETGLTAK